MWGTAWFGRGAGSDGIHPTLRDHAAKDGAPGFSFRSFGMFFGILQKMQGFFGFASE
jgi:hypothetical protein